MIKTDHFDNRMDIQPNIFLRTVRRSRIHLIGATLAFKLSLDIIYIFYMNKFFEDHFLTAMPLNVNPSHYVISTILALIPSCFAPYDKKSFSGVFFLLAIMFAHIPMAVMYGLNDELSMAPLLAAILAIFVAYIASLETKAKIRIPIVANGERAAIAISLVFIAVFLAVSIVSGATSFLNFDISRVYEFRSQASDLMDTGVFAYINLWAQKIFNPLLFILALYKRNIPMMIGSIGIQVYFFGITHHRSHLFVPLLIYLIWLLFTRSISIPRLWFLISVGLLGVLMLITIFHLDTFAALILRRAIFVPASVSFEWFEFFIDKPKVYWADKLLAAGSSSEYTSQSLPRLLGNHMAAGKELNFNSGIIAAGFAQAGVLGIIFYAAVFGGVLKFVNALIRRGVPVSVCAGLLVQPIAAGWTSSDLFSTLLSHGVIVGVIILWILGKPPSPLPLSGKISKKAL